MLLPYYLCSYLVGILPICFLGVQNISEVKNKKILFVIFWYSLLYTFLFAIFACIVDIKQALIITFSSILFIFYGKIIINKIKKTYLPIKIRIINISYLIGLVGIIFIPYFILDKIVWGILLLEILTLLVLTSEAIKYNKGISQFYKKTVKKDVNIDLTLKEGVELPNIYFFIPDSYSGASALKHFYGDGNELFVNWLRKEGFKVYDDAHPNYSHTNYSLPSTLQMNYLVNFYKYDEKANEQMNLAQLATYQYDNMTLKILKKLGYTTHHIVNDYDKHYMDERGYSFDNTIDLAKSYSFEHALVHDTYFRKIIRRILPLSTRKYMLNVFDWLENNVFETKKNFVYCHLMCPHHPFHFDEKGDLPKEDYDYDNPEVYPKMYMDQIKYLNIRFMRIIKSIKKKDPNAVIIIQADHGGPKCMFFHDLYTADNIWLERYSIMRAIYAPENYDLDFVSSVNLFPTIFNNWLEKPIRVKDDHYWFVTSNNGFKMSKLEFETK